MKRKNIIRKLTSLAVVSLMATSFTTTTASAADGSYNVTASYYGSNPVVPNESHFFVNYEKEVKNNKTIYRMHDMKRHIWVFTKDSSGDERSIFGLYNEAAVYDPNYLWNNYKDKITSDTYYSNERFSVNTPALGVLYQTEKAYDYYDATFGWKGTDGDNSELVVNLSSKNGLGLSASPYANLINTGSGIEVDSRGNVKRDYDASDLDAVIHEYTHRVSARKVRWSLSRTTSETGAINEAYADIMGEYGLYYYNNSGKDWKTLASTKRDATISPYSGVYCSGATGSAKYVYNPSLDGNQFYNYKAYCDAKKKEGPIECHAGSTILSHIAYTIDSKFRMPYYLAEKMWFISMDYIPQGTERATFKDCRTALTKALDHAMSTFSTISSSDKDRYRIAVRTAFNEAGLTYGNLPMGDVNLDGKVNSTDIELVNSHISKKKTLGIEQRCQADLDFNGVVDSTDLSKIKLIAK